MGHYSVLSIGRWQFQWKGFLPTFPSFLFTEADFCIERSTEVEDVTTSLAYKTTREVALKNLEAAGYTMEFLADIYDTLKESVEDGLWDALRFRFEEFPTHSSMSEGEIEETIRAHLNLHGPSDPLSDLQDYVDLFRACEAADFDASGGKYVVRRRNLPISSELLSRFQEGALDHHFWVVYGAWTFPPSVVRVALLLSDVARYDQFPEVLFLMLARLLIEASAPDCEVVLELDDLFYTPEEAQDAFAYLPLELAQKVHLYNRMFKVLLHRESDARLRYTKAQVRSMLSQLPHATTPREKGELLEDLVAALFGGEPEFQVVERRYSTGDEEIDLIIKNDVSRPFWMGLASPVLFVECKNWSTSVGVSELRNFEGKIVNHPLCRLGLFIAPGGFSREWQAALLRMSRSTHLVVPITTEDLKAFAYNDTSVVQWLEALICRLV